MKIKNIIKSLLSCLFLASVFISCDYREYADADYPENQIYQSTAVDGVWMIDAKNNENPSMITPGYAPKYVLDKENKKFSVLLGVVQSGIHKRKSFNVDLATDNAIIADMIDDETLPAETLLLPESTYSLPSTVAFPGNAVSAPFQLDINLDALTGANIGKKYAVAVKISSISIKVSEGLGTTVVLIDTAFLEELMN